MTASVNQSKVSIAGPSKGQRNIKTLRQVAMVANVDVGGNTPWRCWKCGNIGHEKKHCPRQSYFEGQHVFQKAKQDERKMTGGPSKCTYAHCGRIGHTEAQYWFKHPHLRPKPFTPQGIQASGTNSLEARMEELQNSLGLLLAAKSITSSAPSSSTSACTSSVQPLEFDRFEYEALGKMMVSSATRSQLKTPSETLKSVRGQVVHDEPNARHQGSADNNGQSRLPLSFGFADLAFISSQGTTSKDSEVHA